MTDAARVPFARRRQILDLLRDNGAASIGQLAKELGVSLATVHRDLRALESESALQRVQGGAALIPQTPNPSAHIDSAWTQRLQKHGNAKLAVGFRALELVNRGDTLFLDGSTTSLAFAVAIEVANLAVTIVTTSPALAHSMTAPLVRIIVVPGQVDQELRIVCGSWSNQFLENFNFTSAFISCAGMSDEGTLYTGSHEIQVSLQLALARAQNKVCLIDASKVGRVASLKLIEAEQLDVIVVESVTEATEQRIAAHGPRVLTAGFTVPEVVGESAIYRDYFA